MDFELSMDIINDKSTSRPKRRRSCQYVKRESLGLSQLEALSLQETTTEKALHIVTSGESAKYSSVEAMYHFHDTLLPDTNMTNTKKRKRRYKSTNSPTKVLSESFGDHVLSEKIIEEFEDFKTQFDNEAEVVSPPKQSKSAIPNELTQPNDSIDEVKQTKSKPSKKHGRRRSADTFIFENTTIMSPDTDMPTDLPMGAPKRRSSRLRRKSVYKSQEEEQPAQNSGISEQKSFTANILPEDSEACLLVSDPRDEFTESVEMHFESPESIKLESAVVDTTVPCVDNKDTAISETTCVVSNKDQQKEPSTRRRKGRPKKGCHEQEVNVEEIYTKCKYVAPNLKTWETIFESPTLIGKSQKLLSTRRYKRQIDFEDFLPQKYKQRRQKATKRGWKPASKKKREMYEKLVHTKLEELEVLELLDQETDRQNSEQSKLTSLGNCVDFKMDLSSTVNSCSWEKSYVGDIYSENGQCTDTKSNNDNRYSDVIEQGQLNCVMELNNSKPSTVDTTCVTIGADELMDLYPDIGVTSNTNVGISKTSSMKPSSNRGEQQDADIEEFYTPMKFQERGINIAESSVHNTHWQISCNNEKFVTPKKSLVNTETEKSSSFNIESPQCVTSNSDINTSGSDVKNETNNVPSGKKSFSPSDASGIDLSFNNIVDNFSSPLTTQAFVSPLESCMDYSNEYSTIYDVSGDSSNLNTAICMYTPPLSNTSCNSSHDSTEGSLLKNSLTVLKEDECCDRSLMLDDSLLTGSTDITLMGK